MMTVTLVNRDGTEQDCGETKVLRRPGETEIEFEVVPLQTAYVETVILRNTENGGEWRVTPDTHAFVGGITHTFVASFSET